MRRGQDGVSRTVVDERAPAAVRVREVGPRDGFQNEPEVIPTARKVELIDALARTGLRRLEVTSFVRADVIPQLADAEEVLAAIDVPEEVAVSVLVPNERGLEGALRSARAASRAARRLRRDQRLPLGLGDPQPQERQPLDRRVAGGAGGGAERARAEGLRCEGVISTSFGCPYEGHVPVERVLDIAARLRDAGAQEIGFGDTTGMANPAPGAARSSRGARADRWATRVELTAHFHNTRGAGSRQRARRAGGRGGRASSRASASSAAARSRRARPATSPPRTSSRCCTRWGLDRHRPPGADRLRAQAQESSAGRWAATCCSPDRSTGGRAERPGRPRPAHPHSLSVR